MQTLLVSTTGSNWTDQGQIICNCPLFMKQYVCKHTLSLAVRFNFAKIPLVAKDISIGRKPKVGRPSLAKRALLTR